MGLPLNRALGDYDIIAGTFFVCGCNEENFVGLTPEQFTRYEKFYHDPQLFHRTPFGILVEHCTTERYAAAMDAVSRPRRPPSRQAPERSMSSIPPRPAPLSAAGRFLFLHYKRRESAMKKFYTAESVTEGHPDKLCDLIADNVLDACLAVDPAARVACEALATRGHIVVAGEISTTVQPDVFNITRDVVRGVGYDPKAFQIDCWLHAQSPDIAGAVNVPLDDTDPDALGAGDQGIVVGYACKETPQFMPLPVVLAHRLTSLLTLARMTDTIHGIGPDGKAQVTVEYAVNEPEHEDAPLRVSTVVLSVQHAANKNPDELAQELTEQVIAPALRGQPVDDTLEILINPSGSFVLGGPEADTGLTGRKLAVDAYGPFAPQGGGALSGKDPTKVDRSGAYMARYIAKNLVAAGMAERCQVTLAYAIGMAEPVMVEVDTFGTCPLCADDCLAKAVRQVFDLTPAGIIETLDLQNPFYARTAVGGHFGREDFPWERVDKVGLLLNAIL